jgi:hypothetical protein
MAYYTGDGDAQNSWQVLQHEMRNGLTGIEPLVTHMRSIFNQYCSQVSGANPFDFPRPTFPFIENGPTLVAQMTDDQSSRSIKLNADESVYPRDVNDPLTGNAISKDNNLTTRLWASYHFWTDYINKVHPEFGDNGKWDDLLKTQLGLFTDTPNVKSLMHAVTANKNIDAVDLIRKMKYKRDMQVNTSTIIKAAPFIYSTDANPSDWWKDDAVFSQNFERYAVDSDSGEDLIMSMKEWPTISPTCFTSKDFAGNVYVNATARLTPKQLAITSEDQREHRAYITESIFGESSSNIDFAITCPVAPDETSILINGLTKESAQSIVDKGDTTRGFMFTEVPDMVWVAEQPVIDTSDIFCTGFFLMMASDTPTKKKSNWHLWFEDHSNYIRNDESRSDDWVLPVITSGKAMETIPDINTDTAKWTKQHVANPTYLSKQKECFIFLGVGIFDKPELVQSSLLGGYLFVDEDYTTPATVAAVKKVAATTADNDVFLGMLHDMLVNAGKGAMSQPDNNNAVLSLFESIRNSSEDQCELNYFVFDPSYGPIEMNFYGHGHSNVNTKLPMLITPEMFKTEEDSVAAIEPKAAYFDRSTTAGGSAEPENLSFFDKDRNGEYQKKMVLPFLTAITYPNIVVDPTVGRIGVKEDSIQAYYGGDTLWWLHVCGRVVLSFVDPSTTKSIWNYSTTEGVASDPTLVGANEFVTKDEMTEAATINAKADPTADAIKGDHAKENIRSNVQTDGGKANEAGETHRSNGSKGNNKKNHKRGGNRGHTKRSQRTDDREKKNNTREREQEEMMNPTGAGDESTQQQDKQFKDNLQDYDPKKSTES